MPTYDYKCDACGNQFERVQSITAPVIRKCPKCGKLKVRRLISAGAGLIFKGSGFYSTDYRSESYKSAAKDESGTTEPKTSTDGKPETGESKSTGESKPKSESKSAEKSPPQKKS